MQYYKLLFSRQTNYEKMHIKARSEYICTFLLCIMPMQLSLKKIGL